VVHKAFGQIQQTGVVKLFKSYKPDYKDGQQVRDFVYVKDAVEVCLFVAQNRRASGIFNVGTGTCRTWLDLAKATFAALGREPKIEFIDMPETLRAKYQYRTEADIAKLRRAGYRQPMTTLEDGVRDYVQQWLLPRG
jgi:ADP-L-glycero-D-manno-heptose 6-epimerase